MLNSTVMFEELSKIINLNTSESLFKDKLGLPIYLSARSIYILNADNVKFAVIVLGEEESVDVRRLKKQLGMYQDKLNMNIAFSITGINRHQRDAFIANAIPFISLPEQVYLPFLGILLQNRYKIVNQVQLEKFTPASQLLFLLLAYSGSEDWLTKTEASRRLGITNMSISRASAQLRAMGLLEEQSKAGAMYISKTLDGSDYFEAGKPYLISPVQSSIYVRNCMEAKNLLYAGETALGEISMLNPPRITIKACKRNKTDADRFEIIDPLLEVDDDYIKIEQWKYDPMLFEHSGHVDEISLYASLQTEYDERVQNEIEKVMEEYKWL